jgi:hypothetical protein
MAYKDYTLEAIKDEFGIEDKLKKLFDAIEAIEPSQWLKQTLSFTGNLPKRSEKAKSEAVVFPILLEMRQRNHEFFNIHSGENLNINKKLRGECDFILSKNTQTYSISYPIFSVVEAKKGDIDLGLPQCIAQMIGSKLYNEKHHQDNLFVYGCVTTADEWLFLKLEENTIFIDTQKYFIQDLPKILGIFQFVINQYKN